MLRTMSATSCRTARLTTGTVRHRFRRMPALRSRRVTIERARPRTPLSPLFVSLAGNRGLTSVWLVARLEKSLLVVAAPSSHYYIRFMTSTSSIPSVRWRTERPQPADDDPHQDLVHPPA